MHLSPYVVKTTFLHNLSTFFEYEDQVRKIIYTTNPIEGMHRHKNY